MNKDRLDLGRDLRLRSSFRERQFLGTIGHVKTVAYVFMDEAQARAHLHSLWLHEFECLLVDDKGKRRLDDTYHPTPDPPAWVKRLGADL